MPSRPNGKETASPILGTRFQVEAISNKAPHSRCYPGAPGLYLLILGEVCQPANHAARSQRVYRTTAKSKLQSTGQARWEEVLSLGGLASGKGSSRSETNVTPLQPPTSLREVNVTSSSPKPQPAAFPSTRVTLFQPNRLSSGQVTAQRGLQAHGVTRDSAAARAQLLSRLHPINHQCEKPLAPLRTETEAGRHRAVPRAPRDLVVQAARSATT